MEDNLYTVPANQPQVDQNISAEQPSFVENAQDIHQEAQVEHKPTPQESFSELRAAKEQAERERNEAVGFIRQLEQMAYQQQQAQQKPPEPVYDAPSYNDDDLIEGRHLKAEFSSLKRELEQQRKQFEESRRLAETAAIENRLRSKFDDFDSVVTYDNCVKLSKLKPEIADSLAQSPDLYNRAAATYTILKELGIAQSNSATYNADQQRVQQNLNKPKPATTLSASSPLSHASAFSGDLTEDRKRQIFQTMQENARRR